MGERKDFREALENDDVSISQIAVRFNLNWDLVQRTRKKYREQRGLVPLNRARKKGF